MRWTPGGRSPDIEDRRNQGGFGYGGFGRPGGGYGGFGGPVFRGGRIGLGGVLLLILIWVISRYTSVDSGAPPAQTSPPYGSAERSVGGGAADSEEKEIQFVSFVLDDAQKTWDRLLPETGTPYRRAKLVLFRDYTLSGCGTAQSATGPFYCPLDEKVYLDLGFFDELGNRMGAPGEFAQAYVIAHELGHHVQKLLGIEQRVRRLRRMNPAESNPLSVRLELQADCLAGVWGHSTEQRKIIDQSDIKAGLDAVAAVGDDRLQKMSRGHVSPDSFTHGSSADRAAWFRRGLDSGTISSCNTFGESVQPSAAR